MNQPMKVKVRYLAWSALAALAAGCSSGSAITFPELHPVKGVVKAGEKLIAGGFIQCVPEGGVNEYIVGGVVADDGTFTLSTSHKDDKAGDRKTGVPAGKYKVTFNAPQGDQTAGPPAQPIQVAQLLTVNPGENNVTIEVPKKK